jgi:hypothetical protein
MAERQQADLFSIVRAKVAALRAEYPELPGPLRCVIQPEGIHTISPSYHVDVRLGKEHSWTVRDLDGFNDIEQEIRRIGERARRQAQEAAELSAFRRERHAQLSRLEPTIKRWLRRRCPNRCVRNLRLISGDGSFIDAIHVTVSVPPSADVTESLRAAEVSLSRARAKVGKSALGSHQSISQSEPLLAAFADWYAKRLQYDDMASAQSRTWPITAAEDWPELRRTMQAFWSWFPMNDASGTAQ